MLHDVVLEKETAGIDTLAKHFTKNIPGLCIKAKSLPVKEILEFFSEQDADIIFSNILLADGFSFDNFNKVNIQIPVVFIIPNKNDVMTSFEIKDQNYLSYPGYSNNCEKPIFDLEALETLLVTNTHRSQHANHFGPYQGRIKSRLLAKNGVSNVSLLLSDIAAVYTKNKLVYIIDRYSKKYFIDKTLTQLENELNHANFFRANRQYIININFVKSFKAYQKVKLLVDINVPELDEPVIISQQLAPAFKKWIQDA